MNKTTEALKLAEEALERLEQIDGVYSWGHALDVIREALAKPVKQEPVAWGCRSEADLLIFQNEGQAKCFADKWELVVVPLYAAPVDAKAIQHCPCCGSDYFAGKTNVDLDKAVKNDPLYLQGRAEALEEAAKVCDQRTAEPGWCCADAIRELKDA